MYSLVCNLQANGAEVRGQSERIISFLQNIQSRKGNRKLGVLGGPVWEKDGTWGSR